jgi:hypothetical protein
VFDSFLARALRAAKHELTKLDDTRAAVACPWQDLHTGRAAGSRTSTVIFAASDKHPRGHFYCSHTSHGIKGTDEVLALLPSEALIEALEQEGT